mgnify:CR=1 FL=1
MGETSAATAREVEATRRQMEDKVAKLSERAPEEARKLMKRVAFGVLSAIVVLLARKLVDKLWERATGELPPTKVERDNDQARPQHQPARPDHVEIEFKGGLKHEQRRDGEEEGRRDRGRPPCRFARQRSSGTRTMMGSRRRSSTPRQAMRIRSRSPRSSIEAHPDATDGQLVAEAEGDRPLDAMAVHVRAVGAGQVVKDEESPLEDDLGMVARRRRILQADIVGDCAAEGGLSAPYFIRLGKTVWDMNDEIPHT